VLATDTIQYMDSTDERAIATVLNTRGSIKHGYLIPIMPASIQSIHYFYDSSPIQQHTMEQDSLHSGHTRSKQPYQLDD